MHENVMILTLGAALGHPTCLISLISLRVPGESRAAILDCCMIHEMVWVLKETCLKTYRLEKDLPKVRQGPLDSSIIENSNLTDCRFFKRINWQTRLKEKRLVCVED